MNHFLPAYSVGALLYCPANHTGIVNSLANEKFGKQFSLALCLEDTIQDSCVADAENMLVPKNPFSCPKSLSASGTRSR